MGVKGTTVTTAHTATGEALTFSTSTPSNVAELRRRAHAATEMHNRNHATGGACGDMMGDEMMGGMPGSHHMMGEGKGSDHMMGGAEGGAHVMGGTMMPQSHATVTDVEMGACITLTPTTTGELKELQSAVRVRADRMQQHGCGMMAKK
jgi:hypothetical protein